MDAVDILSWCFTVAALSFGVFGFLYSTYAAAMFQSPAVPPITRYLRRFCQVLTGVLIVLTGVAFFTAYREAFNVPTAANVATWLIICCFVVLTGFAAYLVSRME